MELRKLISKFLTSLVENNYAQANNDLKKVVEEKISKRIRAKADSLNRKQKLANRKSECSGKAKCKCADCENTIQEESNENESNEDSSKLSKREKFLKMVASKSKKNKKPSSNKKNSKKGNK